MPRNVDYDRSRNSARDNSRPEPQAPKNSGVAIVNDLLYVFGGYSYGTAYAMSGLGIFEPLTFNEQYLPFGYGPLSPKITIVSPENTNYNSSSLFLIFTVNKPAVWMRYSLDGQDNATAIGNITPTRLTDGLHNVKVLRERRVRKH